MAQLMPRGAFATEEGQDLRLSLPVHPAAARRSPRLRGSREPGESRHQVGKYGPLAKTPFPRRAGLRCLIVQFPRRYESRPRASPFNQSGVSEDVRAWTSCRAAVMRLVMAWVAVGGARSACRRQDVDFVHELEGVAIREVPQLRDPDRLRAGDDSRSA